jgi:hypothetical protein
MLRKQQKKEATNFVCEKCDFISSRKCNYTKHLTTGKHISLTSLTEFGGKMNIHSCNNCNKEYKSREGLWYHKKKCIFVAPPPQGQGLVESLIDADENPAELAFLSNLVLEVVKSNAELQKQNQEFQKQMLEVCKTGGGGTNNSYNNNKTFNMQVFLNEQCKDAMNIMDFVNSMTLELSDLEDVGEVGYVEGISKIIIRKLNELDVCKRPIHCSDFKREIMYVRDMDVWSKENNTFDKIRKAIKYVTKKNSDLLIPWIQKYPSGMNIEHPHNDIYMRLMNQAMGGRESFLESENKIIKKISKAVQINKYF